MRYMSYYTPAAGIRMDGPPDPEHMAKMGELVGAMMAEGTLITTGALMGGSAVVTVSQANGAISVERGEGDAPPVGFALIEARDEAHLIELTKRFLSVAGDGKSVSHPIAGPPEE